MATTVEQLLEHAGWARRLARGLVGEADADDLVQETWLAALRHQPGADRPLRAWLQRVLLTRGVNRRRDEQRQGARHEAAARLNREDLAASPEELVGRMEVQRLLAEAVVALPEPLRQTVLLRYYEELSSTEIAAVTGQPAGSVRRHLKEALEAIRAALDRAHSGHRAIWMGALVPFEPKARASISGASAPAIAVLVAAIGTVAVVASPPGRERRQATAVASAPAPPLPGPRREQTPSVHPSPAATLPAALASCQTELEPVRARLAAAETQRRARLEPAALFEESAANPAAQLALGAELERIMKPFEPAATHALECRTWLCRVRVLQPPGGSGAWKEAIRHDSELQRRVRGGSFVREAAIADAVSAVPLEQGGMYLRLADPSGRPLPLDVRPAPPYLAPPPLPTSAVDCRAELEASRARLAELQAIPPPPSPADQLFAQGTLDPAVTARARDVVARALADAPNAYAAEVECRGRSCRVVVPGWMLGRSARDWHDRLLRHPEFVRLRSEQPMAIGAAGLFFTLRP